MVGVSSQICLRASLVKSGCFTDLETLHIRNVKFLNEKFYNMRFLVMFITAICLLFLLKLKWPKNKSVDDLR